MGTVFVGLCGDGVGAHDSLSRCEVLPIGIDRIVVWSYCRSGSGYADSTHLNAPANHETHR